MLKITIHFDGGCRPTNPGNMYGSYSVDVDGLAVRSTFEEYGHGTNNVAEFKALQKALEHALDFLDCNSVDPKIFFVDIFTDSTIVRNRISNRNYKVAKKYAGTAGSIRMAECALKIFPLLDKFGSFKIQWNSREVNVEKFGH